MFSLPPPWQLSGPRIQDRSFCVAGMMSMVGLSLLKKSLAMLSGRTVAGGMLAAWVATYAVAMAHGSAPQPSGLGAFPGQQHDFLQTPDKSWLSQANVSRRVYAATASTVDNSSLAPGAYFRVLARIYGAATEYHAPVQVEQSAQVADEPMPKDEVATFHAMETHVPVALARISSVFGRRPNPLGKGHVFHRGIDLAAPTGTPVYAVAAGTVIRSMRDRSYGNVVVIDHHNGYKTLYAHNSKLLVKVGEKVKAGQPIAKVGSTGHSTGPHLHFEIHRSGQRVDPRPYLAVL
jgi:murein DD-endopeptidase MepM/ murein hydrolase activator NlpD